jgi:hypothetical protein
MLDKVCIRDWVLDRGGEMSEWAREREEEECELELLLSVCWRAWRIRLNDALARWRSAADNEERGDRGGEGVEDNNPRISSRSSAMESGGPPPCDIEMSASPEVSYRSEYSSILNAPKASVLSLSALILARAPTAVTPPPRWTAGVGEAGIAVDDAIGTVPALARPGCRGGWGIPLLAGLLESDVYLDIGEFESVDSRCVWRARVDRELVDGVLAERELLPVVLVDLLWVWEWPKWLELGESLVLAEAEERLPCPGLLNPKGYLPWIGCPRLDIDPEARPEEGETASVYSSSSSSSSSSPSPPSSSGVALWRGEGGNGTRSSLDTWAELVVNGYGDPFNLFSSSVSLATFAANSSGVIPVPSSGTKKSSLNTPLRPGVAGAAPIPTAAITRSIPSNAPGSTSEAWIIVFSLPARTERMEVQNSKASWIRCRVSSFQSHWRPMSESASA